METLKLKLSESFVFSVQKEMLRHYGINLTFNQVEKYLTENNLNFFSKVERIDYINFLSKEITGLYYPIVGGCQDYKTIFVKKVKENTINKGYNWSFLY